MKAFHTIAIPHKDVLEGRLTMDVFAADLFSVYEGRGPEEYTDGYTFFKKTYMTNGIKNLLSIVEKRLSGKGGDPIIQLQTPFGGGKTHSLIALYHKSREWHAKTVVIAGTDLSADETIWGVMEKQITGRIERMTGNASPGKSAIRDLLRPHQPVLILMDELLEYAVKASSKKIGESTLASQTLAFMQELTETVSGLEKACIVVTLPSSKLEHYDEHAERLFQQLQKVCGRVERIYTPVEDSEIANVIRQRLFSSVNEKEVKGVVSDYAEYASKENILPAGVQAGEYRERFCLTYPFLPDMIDILYHRWGSFPTFQRTRGMLRLLAIVLHSLKNKQIGYISPADIDLNNHDIRQDFLKHIGSEFNGIIDADITDKHSGAKKADIALGDAYKGLSLGTRSAAAVFLYSFSGGIEKGATAADIKRCATTTGNPASVISEALEQLKTKLFYLQKSADRYYFSNQPNLNRMVLTRMDNIKDNDLLALEKELIEKNIGKSCLKVYVWTENPSDIPDNENLKLVILRSKDEAQMNEILNKKGQVPRIFRNTVFFTYPVESLRVHFMNILKRKSAYESIKQDANVKLTDDHKKMIASELKTLQKDIFDQLNGCYRQVAVPQQNGWKTVDLGVSTFGEEASVDFKIYHRLHSEGEIIERIASKVIQEKYLSKASYASTLQMWRSTLTTPGEIRMTGADVLKQGIQDGVQSKIFCLGQLQNETPVAHYANQQPTVELIENEIIIEKKLCQEQQKKTPNNDQQNQGISEGNSGDKPDTHKDDISKPHKQMRTKVSLELYAQKGKISDLIGPLRYLQDKFNSIKICIDADQGEMSEQEYQDKIIESLNQTGIDFEEN